MEALALRRRYGRARSSRTVVHLPNMFEAAVTYDRGSDRYRIIFSWPEISNDGHISPSLKHELVKSIAAPAVLVGLTDVSRPTAPRAVREAVRMVVAREADVQHIAKWLAEKVGG